MDKIIFLLLSLSFIGCSVKTSYEPIYIPTKCEIDLPLRPKYNGDPVIFSRDIVVYSKEMECLLGYCVNGYFDEKCFK